MLKYLNNFYPVLRLGILIAVLITSELYTAPAFAESLHDAFTASAGHEEYRNPDAAELKRAEELFVKTLSGSLPFDRLQREWSDLKFDLLKLNEGGASYLVLREQEQYRCGRGFYIFRQGGAKTAMLQMPHRFHDKMTGEIGLALFKTGQFSTGAWNSIPRWKKRGGVKVDADLVHRDATYLSALTSAFLRQQPTGFVVQLHGFEGSKRREPVARKADMVISSGSRTVTRQVRALAECIAVNRRLQVLIYPEDTRELGATTNTIGHLMARQGSMGFIHLELNHAYRRQLVDDSVEQARFATCIKGVR